MQTNNNQLYKLTAAKTGNSEQLYKDIGNFVFNKLYESLKRPSKLIIWLRGVGSWYLRKKRLQIQVDNYPPTFDRTVFSSEKDETDYRNKLELYYLFKDRLMDYEQFTNDKKSIREIRNEYQTLLESFKRKDEGPETSKTNIT